MSDDNKPVEFSGTLSDLGDMSTVETKYPVIAAGLYQMKIKGFKKSDKPNTKTGNPQSMLIIELATEDMAKNKNNPDADVPPGHVLTDRVLLTPVGDMTQNMINQKLARIMEAATGNHDGAFNTADLVGKVVSVNVALRPERTVDGKTYAESNEISKYIAKG